MQTFTDVVQDGFKTEKTDNNVNTDELDVVVTKSLVNGYISIGNYLFNVTNAYKKLGCVTTHNYYYIQRPYGDHTWTNSLEDTKVALEKLFLVPEEAKGDLRAIFKHFSEAGTSLHNVPEQKEVLDYAHIVGEHLTDMVNFYINHIYNLDGYIDNVVLDIDELLGHDAFITNKHAEQRLTYFIEKFFKLSYTNANTLAEILTEENTKPGIRTYPVLTLTPNAGLAYSGFNNNSTNTYFKTKAKMLEILQNCIIDNTNPIHSVLEKIVNKYEDFKNLGYCNIYLPTELSNIISKYYTVTILGNNTFKVIK